MDENQQTSLNQYCEISTCMGVTDCHVTKSHFGKIFWVVIIIIGLSVTVFQTVGTFKEYLNDNDYKITVSKVAIDTGIPFPFITICNYNRAKQSIINMTKLDPKVLSYVFQMIPASYDIPLSYSQPDELSTYQQAWDKYVAKTNETDILNFLRRYGHNSTESIMQITYGTQMIVKNFTEVFTVYGRCWRVTITIPQLIPGSTAGVKMILNSQLNEYMNDVLFNNYYQQGFAILLSYTEEPLMSDITMLSPGTSSNIVIKASRNTINNAQYPMKPKPCRENATLKVLKAPYTPQNCIYDCYMYAVMKKCGCVLFAETQLQIPLCNLSTAINVTPTAVADGSKTFYGVNIIPTIVKCSKDCRNPCEDYMTIEASSSSTTRRITGDHELAIKAIQKAGAVYNWSHQYVKESLEDIAIAQIYFTSTELTIVETGESTPIMTFIANVGGQLGLWMGISILSVVQLLYWISVGFLNGEYSFKSKKVQHNDEIMKETRFVK